MSFVIQGPYPLMQSTLLLPSPKIGNQKNLASSVQVLRAMDGTVFTYVKPKRGRKVRRWDFVTTKDKVREAIQFVEQYSGGLLRIIDQNDAIVIGYLTINPLEVAGEGRAEGFPSGEVYRWTLSLEEKV
jgi:hypothetical protein